MGLAMRGLDGEGGGVARSGVLLKIPGEGGGGAGGVYVEFGGWGLGGGPFYCDPTKNLLFWREKKKSEDPPKKNEDFPLCRTLENLGKGIKNAQEKQGKPQKTKKMRKTKKARIWRSRVMPPKTNSVMWFFLMCHFCSPKMSPQCFVTTLVS